MAKNLPNPAKGDVYVKVKGKLNDYYMPKKSKQHDRFVFLKKLPEQRETIIVASYAARLRENAWAVNLAMLRMIAFLNT